MEDPPRWSRGTDRQQSNRTGQLVQTATISGLLGSREASFFPGLTREHEDGGQLLLPEASNLQQNSTEHCRPKITNQESLTTDTHGVRREQGHTGDIFKARGT